MALLDLMGLGADKQAVILDIGAAYTKVGFAGEHAPRHIIRTEVNRLVNDEFCTIKLFEKDFDNEDERSALYKDFFHMIYFKYLLVNPKERRVVVCEPMLKSIEIRNMIAKVLFKHFEVVSIIFIPSHLLVLFTCGVQTGLIIDCGYQETTIIPIYEQVPILSAVEYNDCAGKAVHDSINNEVMSRGIVLVGEEEKSAKSLLKLSEKTIEDIKVRCCFVGRRNCDLVAVPVKYPVDENKLLNVDGKLRAHAFDILFEADEEGRSLATTILDSILKCPIDCRKALAQNIIVTGGTSMSTGFLQRLFSELKNLLQDSKYSDKLFLRKLAFREAPVPKNYVCWQGAALFGALEILSDHSISRERYSVDSKIPDWSSVLSFNKDDMSKSNLDDKYKWASFRKSLSSSGSSASPPPSSITTTSPSSISERIKKELGLKK